MRYPYQTEPDLQITPIEKIRLPFRSRDELPPILAGLQWLWMHPRLRWGQTNCWAAAQWPACLTNSGLLRSLSFCMMSWPCAPTVLTRSRWAICCAHSLCPINWKTSNSRSLSAPGGSLRPGDASPPMSPGFGSRSMWRAVPFVPWNFGGTASERGTDYRRQPDYAIAACQSVCSP